MENPTPFDKDERNSYVPEIATALHQALLRSNEVFTKFRAGFIGKCSPVHSFWGSFDLAVSSFSGHKAPPHPGGIPNLPDWVAREAYSHEVCSCGFWPGNEAVPFAAFYSYIYPEPQGYKSATIKPENTYYHKNLGEFILPYNEVQQANGPFQTLMDFLDTTYRAAADTAHWDRENLESHKRKNTAGNRRLAQWRAKCEIESLCFYQTFVLAESEVLLSPALRQAPNRSASL